MYRRNPSQTKAKVQQIQSLTIKNVNPQTNFLINVVSPVDAAKRPGQGPKRYNKISSSRRGSNKSDCSSSQRRYRGRESQQVSSLEQGEIQSKRKEQDSMMEYIDSFFGKPKEMRSFDSPKVKKGASFSQMIESHSKDQSFNVLEIPLQSNQSFVKNSSEQQRNLDSNSCVRGEMPKRGKFFFSGRCSKLVFGQLFWGQPNFKGNNYAYNQQKLKCQPYFRCEGCLKEFPAAPALGGHLSKCPQKVEHAEKKKQRKQLFKNNKKGQIKKIQEVSESQSEQVKAIQIREQSINSESDQPIIIGSSSEIRSSSKKVDSNSKGQLVKENVTKKIAKQNKVQKVKRPRFKPRKAPKQS